MRYSHKMFIILCLSSTAFALPGAAQDVPPAVKAMLDSIERQTQAKPTYDSITTNGDGSVTITKLELNKPAQGNGPSVTRRIDETVLSNISDAGGGIYEIGSATFSKAPSSVASR